MASEVKFIDIMEPRRRRGDKFMFMSRYWNAKKTLVLDKCYSPQDLKDIAANSMYIDAIIEAESANTGIRKEELKDEVIEYLEEMGLDKKMYVIRWIGLLFLKISEMMKTQVFVNESVVFQLKNMMGNNPVLFLPTHRSYADFCLLTYLCYNYDIEIPAVAAGMDFYSMAVLGRCMRETCAFYIRRTLTGAPLYAATLRQYVRTAVARLAAPIEFFVEGTRSRSNKALPPKYGMLSMALAPLFAGEVSDVTIVPINISYDRLMEQTLFAYEHLGVPKPKESTGGFIKALNSLNDHFGNIYINLGTPLSLREYFDDVTFYSKETTNPVDMQQVTPEQFELVQDLARHVVKLQQNNTVVTITNLMSLVLMKHIMLGKTLHCDQLIPEVEWVIKVLGDLGASIFENDVKASVDRILLVHSKMVRVNKDRCVEVLCTEHMVLTEDVKRKMKGHVLKVNTMANAIPIIQIQLYVNPVLHYIIPPAIIFVIINKKSVNRAQLENDFNVLRRLLKYEYFYSEMSCDMTFENAVNYCLRHNVMERNGDFYVSGADEEMKYLLRWSIWPALTDLMICMELMKEYGRFDHKRLLAGVQERVEMRRCHPYCLSLEAIGNCVQGLISVGAVTRLKTSDTLVYEVVSDVITSYHSLVESVMPSFETDFGTSNPVISQSSTSSRL